MVLGVVGKIGSGKSEIIRYLQDKYSAISFSCDEIAKRIIEEEGLDIFNSDEVFTNPNLQEDIRTNFHPLVFSRIFENLNNLSRFILLYYTNFFAAFLTKENINNFLNLNNLFTEININNFYNFLNRLCSCKLDDKEYLYNFLNKNNFSEFNNFYEFRIIIESALPNDEMFKMCDKTIYIDCAYDIRVKRLKESRGYSEEKVKLIYNSQNFYNKYYDKANFKIDNCGSREELISKVEEVINEICIVSK